MSRRNELDVLIDTLSLPDAVVSNMLYEYVRSIGKIRECRDFIVNRAAKALRREFGEPEASDGKGVLRKQGEQNPYKVAIEVAERSREIKPSLDTASDREIIQIAGDVPKLETSGVEHIHRRIVPPKPNGNGYLPLPDEPLISDDNDTVFQKGRAEMRDRIRAANGSR